MSFLPFIFLFCIVYLPFVDGETNDKSSLVALEKSLETRQDGIMRDLVNLLVEEKREREEMRKQIHEVKEQIDILKNYSDNSNSGNRIGFMTFLTKVKYISGIIKFEGITYNFGNGYNKTTGIFICKIPGLYLFHLTVMIRGKGTCAEIMKNHSPVVYAYSSNTWNSGSGIALLMLKRGDVVYVKPPTRYYFHSGGTNFMGLLISADKQ